MSEETTDNTVDTTDQAEAVAEVIGTDERGRRKSLMGVVVSDKMNKTIVVLVEDRVKRS